MKIKSDSISDQLKKERMQQRILDRREKLAEHAKDRRKWLQSRG